jgi:hypothetical protein
MPILNDDTLEQNTLPTSHYGYTATKPDELGATEYTLATVVLDISGSTSGFRAEMEEVFKATVRACRQSPRADNLLLRAVVFADRMEELHGYKLLSNINEGDYAGVLSGPKKPNVGVSTALYDASLNAVEAMTAYAQTLKQPGYDFDSNAIVVVITDGMDTDSRASANSVGKALKNPVNDEVLESVRSILIKINVNDPTAKRYLADFEQKAGFDQSIDAGDADDKTIAKVSEFVSKSISAQSQALSTGGPSQSLSF